MSIRRWLGKQRLFQQTPEPEPFDRSGIEENPNVTAFVDHGLAQTEAAIGELSLREQAIARAAATAAVVTYIAELAAPVSYRTLFET